MQVNNSVVRSRREAACDECKRRKVRCSSEPVCSNCVRDRKTCSYSSPSHRVAALQRTLRNYELLVESIGKAWTRYLPHVSLEDALSRTTGTTTTGDQDTQSPHVPSPHHDDGTIRLPSRQSSATVFPLPGSSAAETGSISDVETPEQSNAEDYEFDESQDYGSSIDGMGLLTSDAGKAGYTGPQSGIAALKILRSLPFGQQIEVDADAPLRPAIAGDAATSLTVYGEKDIESLINDYFIYYHPAYPLLHEGLFRARLSGAVAKPRDGSWPLLLNIVAAMGAFAGGSTDSDIDWQYYQLARKTIALDVIEKGSLCFVQGLTIMANYLQKRNKPNAGFALIGIAWSMALAIGLHREFGTASTTPYTMELRRRTWWTLFVFVSGAQLTLGRPPASLVGINLRVPTNLDDVNMAVDMSELPGPQEGPTTTTCLISQVRLAQIANRVQTELLTNQIPNIREVDALNQRITTWKNELPSCFDEQLFFMPWFELPKRVLLWRSYHLRIVLERPFLFQAVTNKVDLRKCEGLASDCIKTADTCVDSICRFLKTNQSWRRGFAWYATYWLTSASFVHATCFAYTESGARKAQWASRLQQAVDALDLLGSAHVMTSRAKRVLQKMLHPSAPTESSSRLPVTGAETLTHPVDTSLADFSADYFALSNIGEGGFQDLGAPNMGDLMGDVNDHLLWPQSDPHSAELFDAAGGVTLQDQSRTWQ
ncbi:hypothetical protein K431DRAFT_323003 [Polychaeton citri CBS 116435]|uniref:Zn(2)-C6 fungal-type domain-containing protein n=1 Tax=Polychaeton citri CBS 116435 TaxID=1314669 RepID=A0A9P4PZ78_9PEZI|nr:hypothetical protein K431DRAFT_323003 [Polychaeton citri CBS 116435]